MPPRLPIIIAKRYIVNLKKNDVPVTAAWLLGANAAGQPGDEGMIEIAFVLDHFEDTPENRRLFEQLSQKIDLRIRVHPFDKKEFAKCDPFVEGIKKTGIDLEE